MSETKPLRSFGLMVGGIFALIGVWPAVWRGQPLRLWSLLVGGTLMALALACLRGKDPMLRTLTPEAESYRVVRQPRPAAHMRHQF
jgi:hypothetical protein